jgi:SAM-dependent methyltransferase
MEEQTIKKIVDSPPKALRESVKRAAAGLSGLTRRPTFRFSGREYRYCFDTYNLACRNERTVEIPIAARFLSEHAGRDVLEVGNVLSHYMNVSHDVLDRYEVARGVVNEDAADFDPGREYDAIISVSTLEHIGTYEDPPDPGRAAAAVTNLVRLLKPGGELLATFPVGLNPAFEALLDTGEIRFDELHAMRRVGPGNTWEQTDPESAKGSRYATKGFRANAIIVAIIRKEER